MSLTIDNADVAAALQPLLVKLPITEAMTRLVVTRGGGAELVELAQQVTQIPVIKANPVLESAIWLYVDELDRSHTISQGIDDATGSFWHGIMHRREGDVSNSHYWFRNTGAHPAMDDIDGYDGHAFIDEVAAAHRRGEAPQALIDQQRREWVGLFNWCVGESS